jgi:hypothetical protein
MLLSLLFVKHWFVDFFLQTEAMIKSKGIYGSPCGVMHSLQHAGCTLALLLLATSPLMAVTLAVIDGLVHYHIDWLKMNYGSQDMKTPEFWNHFGLDQLAHALTYIGIFNALL